MRTRKQWMEMIDLQNDISTAIDLACMISEHHNSPLIDKACRDYATLLCDLYDGLADHEVAHDVALHQIQRWSQVLQEIASCV